MPAADKRARKKENARAAREQREAAARRRKQLRSAITVGVVVAIFAAVIALIAVTGGSKKKAAPGATSTTRAMTTTTDPKLDAAKTYVATIKTNLGVIKVRLDAKKAPIGAAHFVQLARKHVYDGSRWHRVIKGFVVQGGAQRGDPNSQYGHSVVAEVPKGKYGLGDIAAAKLDADPAGTYDAQFFIVTGPQGEALPDLYADFGKVTSGMDVVRKIEALPTDSNQDPTKKATIDTVTITES